MVKTYSFDVDFIDVDNCFTLRYKVASSSLRLAYAKLCKQIVDTWSTRVVSASVRLIYEVDVHGLISIRSLPSRYASVILDCEGSTSVCS